MQMVVQADGAICCLYDEAIDLQSFGEVSIARGSHVEPDSAGRWFADLSPVSGPRLGPFELRSQALIAEQEWLECYWLGRYP